MLFHRRTGTWLGCLLALATLFVTRGSSAYGPQGPEPVQADKVDTNPDSSGDVGPDVNVMLGAVAASDLTAKQFMPGLQLATDATVVDGWLAIEVGFRVQSISGGPVSVPVDFLAKKPFRMNENTDLSVGIGPEVVRDFGTFQSAELHVGALIAGNLQYWPWNTRTFGVFLEPMFELVSRDTSHSGIGTTAGLLFRM